MKRFVCSPTFPAEFLLGCPHVAPPPRAIRANVTDTYVMGGSGGAVSPKSVLAPKAPAWNVVGFERCAPMGETASVMNL